MLWLTIYVFILFYYFIYPHLHCVYIPSTGKHSLTHTRTSQDNLSVIQTKTQNSVEIRRQENSFTHLKNSQQGKSQWERHS